MAKGSRNPKSKLKGQLQPFIPCTVTLSGRSGLKTLTNAEQTGINAPCAYLNHVSMLYCNELLLLLNLDQEACEVIYPVYARTIAQLKAKDRVSLILRKFEWFLSGVQGYELSLPNQSEATDLISFDPSLGLQVTRGNQGCSHQTIADFLANQPIDTEQLRAVNRLMRTVVNHLVNGKTIQSRLLLK